MAENPLAKFEENDFSEENYNRFDLHRPYVDNIVLVSDGGQPMRRESDLIDVWFDSGAMPYAQAHYPFEKTGVNAHGGGDFSGKLYPADFIAEGVDQTRGWFFTLHALATLLFDSVAFKNIISNGLVLDKNGNKMSKRLGNGVDPFEALAKYGPDAIRWYMATNAQPWDNLKYDPDGMDEVRRKFFGTLYNTYSFFALYANVDGFTGAEPEIPVEKRPEIDRWIISLLNSLVIKVTESLDDYDMTPAARAIQDFVNENLSNWYVRLNRKRFWGGGMSDDKLAAYQTLYTCLETVSMLAAPFAPFIADRIFGDLNAVSGRHSEESVHLSLWPKADQALIDPKLESMMDIAQRVTSMILSLRRKANIKVRQPLAKVMIPMFEHLAIFKDIKAAEPIILSEVNIKEIEYVADSTAITKRIKPNFKTIGPKYPQQMKAISAYVAKMSQADIAKIEAQNGTSWVIDDVPIGLDLNDFEITSEDMPGWLVANDGPITVALDVTLTEELKQEGVARELVNRIQNIRKESGFEVTDKIRVAIEKNEAISASVARYGTYIAGQVLADGVELAERVDNGNVVELDDISVKLSVEKI
jgi:isoleucyl-tRNA synthetase